MNKFITLSRYARKTLQSDRHHVNGIVINHLSAKRNFQTLSNLSQSRHDEKDLRDDDSIIGLKKYKHKNPLENYRAYIAQNLTDITDHDYKTVYNALRISKNGVLGKGDFKLVLPILGYKGQHMSDFAQKVIQNFPSSSPVRPYFISEPHLEFEINSIKLAEDLIPAILKDSNWGVNETLGLQNAKTPSHGRKRVIIEFSSPNIAKPFHQGHLRSTIMGGFLANLYQSAGWDVVRMNYLGDWGKQYGLVAVGFETFGSEESLKKNPIKHLYDVYVKANNQSTIEQEKIQLEKQAGVNTIQAEQLSLDQKAQQYFKAMSEFDPKALENWERFRSYSVEKYVEIYARLNIKFDVYSGESQVNPTTIKSVMNRIEAKGLVSIDRNALIVDFSKVLSKTHEGKQLKNALLQKSDGTHLYITRDIGAVYERVEKYQFDQMIYVVADQQDLHLKQLFKLIQLMDSSDLYSKLSHISFGMVRGMSTRKGGVIFLDDVLNDVRNTMLEVLKGKEIQFSESQMSETADILGVSAVMVQDFMGKRGNGYTFNLERMCSFQGDTGPSIQYAHARLSSLISQHQYIKTTTLLEADFRLLSEKTAHDLVRILALYPEIWSQTLTNAEPNTLLTYLFRLIHAINASYGLLMLNGSSTEVKIARLALFKATRSVLNHGMRLLGLTPLDKM